MADVKNKRINIYIDQTSAQQALETLQKTFDKLSKKIEEGRQAGKNMTKEIAKLKETESAIKEVQAQIDNGLRPSFAQTQSAVFKLRNELKRLSEDDPAFAIKLKQYRMASEELNRLNEAIQGVQKTESSWLADAKTVAFGVIIGNTVQAALESVGGYLGGIISGNAKLSDSLADVEKATGLTSQQVQTLNGQLGKIDTRTATSDLREIAVGLGQVGEAANKANVQAIDKIVVALGDEFGGGANEITTTLSVLRNNLDDLKTGNYADDVTHIGNALNVLGSEGLATAPVVTDIANRIAGIGRTFKLSSGQILGLGATFQELGIETERGSTAVTKLFQKIGSEPDKFAKVAGKSVTEFKHLIDTDMLGAFTLVAEGAKKAGGSNVVFSQVLKELDADGSGAGEVLSKLGSNAELLSKKVSTATEALKTNSSITEEFGKKNTTLGAELDKLKKKLGGLIESKSLGEFFAAGVRAMFGFIDVLKAIPTFIANNKTALALLVVGIATMNAAYIAAALATAKDTALKIINATVTRATAIATNISAAAQLAFAEIVALATGRITLATAAQRLWNIALMLGAGPIGAIVLAAGALVLVIGNLIGATKTLTTEQKIQNELQSKAAQDISDQKADIDTLTSAVKNNALSLDDRKKALQGLININPAYLSGLTLENLQTAEGKKIIDEYVKSLDRMAEAKASQSFKEDLFKKRFEASVKEAEAAVNQPKSRLGNVGLQIQDIISSTGLDFGVTNTSKNKQAKAEVSNVDEQIRVLNEINQKKIEEDTKLINEHQAKLKELKQGTKEFEFEQTKMNDLIRTRNILMGLNENTGISVTPKPGQTTAVNPFGDKQTPDEKAAARKANKEDSERNKLLEELRTFQEELQRIGMQADDSEIDRIEKKYASLIDKAKKYSLSYIKLESEKNRAIAYLIAQEEQARLDFAKKQAVIANEETYKNFISQAVDEGEGKKDVLQEQYAKRLITKKQLEEQVRKTDIETLDYEIAIAQSFVGISKQASSDVVIFRKKQNKEQITDAVKTREQLDAIEKRERTAGAAVAVLKTVDGTKPRLDALINQLQVERDLKLQNEELTLNEIAQINEETRQKIAETTKNFYLGQIQQTLEFISSGLDIISKFNDSKTSRENAQLKKDLKDNDARRASIKKLEESKVISSQEARRRLNQLDQEDAQKKEALEKKQFERNKKLQIAQALINGAMGITSILAAIPGPIDILSLGTARLISIGLNIATTAAAVTQIASQKFADGGVVKPKKLKNGKIASADKNIPEQSNGDNILATVKTGEVILNEEQQRRLGGPAVFRSIGVPGFAAGGMIGNKVVPRKTGYSYPGLAPNLATNLVPTFSSLRGGTTKQSPATTENTNSLIHFSRIWNVPGFMQGGIVKAGDIQNHTVNIVNNITHHYDNRKVEDVKVETAKIKAENGVVPQPSAHRRFEMAKLWNIPGFITGGITKANIIELKNGKVDQSVQNIPQQPNGDNILATVKTGEVILNEEQQRKLGGPRAMRAAGVPGFAGGGLVMKPFWQTRPYQRLDVPAITRSMSIVKFAEGGKVGNAQPIDQQQPATAPIVIESKDEEMKNLMRGILNRLDNPVAPTLSLKKIEEAQAQKDRIRKDAGLK